MSIQSERQFELFFSDPLYLLYKNHLYNYLVRRFVVLRNFRLRHSSERILELGCGISPMLKTSFQAIRTDVSWRALAYLGDGRAVACDATQLPFREDSVRSVVCSEVLEHIEKDEAVLDEISRVLEPGGELVLTLPMRPELFGFDDFFVGHYRRYNFKKLADSLSSRNFGEFQYRSLLGSLEKWIMERVTRFFSFLKKDASSKRGEISVFGIRIFAWLFFPFYLLVNYLLAVFVYFQARFTPVSRAVTLFIRCRKNR